jgi:hypothetical protein
MDLERRSVSRKRLMSASSAQLEVTFYAEPAEARPDIAHRVRERATRIPYPPQANCAVTPATGPTLRNNARHPDALVYTVQGAGLALQGDPGQLFEGVSELRWFPDPFASVSMNGQLLDEPSVTLRADLQRSAAVDGEYYVATTVFPAPGGWQLRGVSSAHTHDVVYVYPTACAPNDDGTPQADACRPPE